MASGTPMAEGDGVFGEGVLGWGATHLHLCQVLHPPRDLPGKRDEVAHGQGPFIWVVQVAGVAAASAVPAAAAAHVTWPCLAALTEETPKGAILGIFHDEEKWPCRQSGDPEIRLAPTTERASVGSMAHTGVYTLLAFMHYPDFRTIVRGNYTQPFPVGPEKATSALSAAPGSTPGC